MKDTRSVYHVPFSRSGAKGNVVHLSPKCHHIKGDPALRGPKPKHVVPNATVCQSCTGNPSGAGNDKRQVTRLLELADPEDVGLSPVGERGT